VSVDHGLLRPDEGEGVERAVSGCFVLEWFWVCANECMLGALSGISDPEVKRRIIGRAFVEESEEERGYRVTRHDMIGRRH